jgi:hypothetical protein
MVKMIILKDEIKYIKEAIKEPPQILEELSHWVTLKITEVHQGAMRSSYNNF